MVRLCGQSYFQTKREAGRPAYTFQVLLGHFVKQIIEINDFGMAFEPTGRLVAFSIE